MGVNLLDRFEISMQLLKIRPLVSTTIKLIGQSLSHIKNHTSFSGTSQIKNQISIYKYQNGNRMIIN